MIGSNTTEAHPVIGMRIKQAVHRGARLVVADPRRIWLTKIAQTHLQLRPGSDVWLLNAMLHTILAEGLEDAAYVAEHTEGIEELRAALEPYTPEAAERETGVPAETIREVARAYATEPDAMILYTLGITEHVHGVKNVWALANLVLATGHLGRERTGLMALRGQNNVQGGADAGANPGYLPGYQPVESAEARAKFSAAWGCEVPAEPGLRVDEIVRGLGGAVRGLYLVGEDPAKSEPNTAHVEAGLAALEFLVVQDIFLTETARRHADVVLPAACFAEKDGVFTNTERRVSRVRAAVEPPGEARPDWQIVGGLAHALGAQWPEYASAEAVWDEFTSLAPLWAGISWARLEENGIQWPCPEPDHPGTQFLHEGGPARGRGLFHVVEAEPPAEEPDGEFPFALLTGRTLYHYNADSMTGREEVVLRKQPEAFFELHCADAARLGIADGALARLVSRRGAIEARAEVGERVRPGTVWTSFHFAEANGNVLANDAVDPHTGTPEYKLCAVRVEAL